MSLCCLLNGMWCKASCLYCSCLHPEGLVGLHWAVWGFHLCRPTCFWMEWCCSEYIWPLGGAVWSGAAASAMLEESVMETSWSNRKWPHAWEGWHSQCCAFYACQLEVDRMGVVGVCSPDDLKDSYHDDLIRTLNLQMFLHEAACVKISLMLMFQIFHPPFSKSCWSSEARNGAAPHWSFSEGHEKDLPTSSV